ncbi:MAG: DNA/RNA nuclease SfsA [Bdellovibrionaceae bacterium]|nr:DNA/RNA nuclease SfsA [Pseudobdellovibrionaceae bacterium]
MKFHSKLQNGTFLKRYKRFFADLEWDGQMITAHVPNTGSLKGCNDPGSPCLFSVSDDPARKLKYTLEMIQAKSGAWVGVNTSSPNKIVKEALEARLLPHWKNFASIKAEAKLDAKTRFDFEALDANGNKTYLEVKNVTMAQGDVALFPDAVTERGQKHLRELMRLSEEGFGTELIFTVQRGDVKSFAPADEIDAVYGKLLREARDKGVRITVLMVELSETEVRLTDRSLTLVF